MTPQQVLALLASTHSPDSEFSDSEIAELKQAGAAVGFSEHEIALRTAHSALSYAFLLEAKERLRVGARRLMAAIAHQSEAELEECLKDPVPTHRQVAAIELARLRRQRNPS